MSEWFMQTPTLRALSKMINLYYLFKIGYDVGMGNDLSLYILTDEELEALQGLLQGERQKSSFITSEGATLVEGEEK